MAELIEYPPEPESGETLAEWKRRALNPWRMEMKRKLLVYRGWTCEREGCNSRAEHLDEGCVTRRDMMGLNAFQQWAAFASANLFLLCADCNVNCAHDRDGAWERACARFRVDVMKTWYAGIGLKSPRFDWIVG